METMRLGGLLVGDGRTSWSLMGVCGYVCTASLWITVRERCIPGKSGEVDVYILQIRDHSDRGIRCCSRNEPKLGFFVLKNYFVFFLMPYGLAGILVRANIVGDLLV